MAALPNAAVLLRNPSRRSFLWSFTSFGLVSKTRKKTEKRQSEPIYRFLTPDFEVRMSVQYFANSSAGSFRFRDQLTNRAFCLSASGEEDRACLQRFVGSMAIAHYDFRSLRHPQTPLHVRECVHTIDQDSRMSPRPPFERILAAESEVVPQWSGQKRPYVVTSKPAIWNGPGRSPYLSCFLLIRQVCFGSPAPRSAF
jgi:hypothetical protein